MKRALLVGLFGLFVAVACETQPTAPVTAPLVAAPVTAVPPAAAAPVEAVPSAEEVPVPEDFEQEAVTRVAAENYRGELDRIAAEIQRDNE